jgi:hypothetical protein
MLYISYRGIYRGQNYDQANTPAQIKKALRWGLSVAIDAWFVDTVIYLGNDQPLYAVDSKFIQGNKFWINARNADMVTWLAAQPAKLYPNWFSYDDADPPPYVTTSSGKLWTFGTVPVNDTSIVVLPEINDRALFSTVNLKCYGVCSTYLNFIRRMRNQGDFYNDGDWYC